MPFLEVFWSCRRDCLSWLRPAEIFFSASEIIRENRKNSWINCTAWRWDRNDYRTSAQHHTRGRAGANTRAGCVERISNDKGRHTFGAKEKQAYRLVLPSILDQNESVSKDILVVEQEMEAYRDMPPKIMAETAEVWKQVGSLQFKLTAYRLTIPDISQEVEATREMIPPMLDRVDNMIADASDAGKRASEGAVAGVFSGVFKAPLSVFTSALPKKHSTDAPYATEAAMKVINDEDLDGFVRFNNRGTGTQGSVTLVE